MWEAMETWFDSTMRWEQEHTREAHQTEKTHGRIVEYHIRTTDGLNGYFQRMFGWPDVGQVVCIERVCTDMATQKESREVHYAISSLTIEEAPPKVMLQYWRHHWHIENKEHWVRDVVFGEDSSRCRSGMLPAMLALLRSLVIARLRLAGKQNITAARSQMATRIADVAFLVGVLLE